MDNESNNLPFSITFTHGQPTGEQLEAAIQQAVLSGQLPPGERLPDRHAIARALRLHPDTVRHVLDVLRKAGWIQGDDERPIACMPAPADAERVRLDLIRRQVTSLRQQAHRLGISNTRLLELINEEDG